MCIIDVFRPPAATLIPEIPFAKDKMQVNAGALKQSHRVTKPYHFHFWKCHQFTISEINLATHNFNESLIIGHGGFGMVYKGTITNGSTHLVVAIKRMDSTSNQGAAEFWNEVQMLSKLRHCHLVSLIGYCNHGEEMILVYEYIPHGSLEDHLHKFQTPLSWIRRLKICIGVARGLDYLHTGTGIKHGVIHRDVKTSNILLDDNWAAKISDFGLSKLAPINQPLTYVNTFVKGTFGYLDPDYYATGRLTRKSDVYAFGVVLLEVLSGKRAVDTSLDDEHWGLVNWAQESMKEGRLKQIVDYTIRVGVMPKCLKQFAHLANRCVHDNPKQRPTMAEVVACLESILVLHEKAIAMSMRTFWGRRLNSLEFYFDTVGGENRILRRFEFKTINVATENFAKDNRMLRCSLAPFMYKGKLQNGRGISIARIGCQDYKNEVSLMVKLEHENLLPLIGYSIEGKKVYLVYDFAFCSNLHLSIIGLLDWNKRKKVILGVARALLYLHQHDVIHANVIPGNILLDESFHPKLSNLEFSRCLTTINEAVFVEMGTMWETLEYIAPELHQANRLSAKADVYSFGVLVLETTIGCRMYNCLKRNVWKNWMEGTSSNILDPRIHGNPSSITRFIHIGLLCVQEDADNRPTMEEVVGMLTNSSSINLPIPKEYVPPWMIYD
ncbi:probable kinase CHARK isoform X1 [Lactuca sativa]|nr:probable kinase CHARK isoform X1 [Lactuca sativa]